MYLYVFVRVSAHTYMHAYLMSERTCVVDRGYFYRGHHQRFYEYRIAHERYHEQGGYCCNLARKDGLTLTIDASSITRVIGNTGTR